MKDLLDESMGIVTLIVESWDNFEIKPTDPLRFVKRWSKKMRCSTRGKEAR